VLSFLKRIALFSLLLLVCLWLIKKTVPYHYGNDLLAHKLEYLEENIDNYNTLFVGSSHVYRHVDVQEFDNLTGNKSYNLGNDGMFGLEANYIVEQFLERNEIDRPFNVFYHKTEPRRIAKKNLHTNRAKYFMDFHRLRIGITHFWKLRDWTQIYYHIVSFLENKLAIGQVREIIDYHTGEKKSFHNAINQSDGFYHLNKQLQLEPDSKVIARNHKQYRFSDAYKQNKPVDKKLSHMSFGGCKNQHKETRQ